MLNSNRDLLATPQSPRLKSSGQGMANPLDGGDHPTNCVTFRSQKRSRLDGGDRGSGRNSDLTALAEPSLFDRGSGRFNRRVSVTSEGDRIGKKDWGARFLNLSSSTVAEYENYDFSQANAVHNLGDRNKKGKVAAQLEFDFGWRSSPEGVNSNYFAMEAQTQVRLGKGQFYRLTSQSDDGIRFFFKDKKTQDPITTLDGDWQNRKLSDPTYSQLLTATGGGTYDFAVQYYEQRGNSAANITLERVNLEGEVVASGLNLRTSATTIGSTVSDVLAQGDQFKILRQVQSPNDSTYQNWYQIVTSDQQKGYVVADAKFVDILGEGDTVVTVGSDTTTPPTLPPDFDGSDLTKGLISSKVWITADDKISFRNDKDISGTELGRLSAGTPVTILGETPGGRYLNSFDLWYNISVELNGTTQEGYVAAYYVERTNADGTFGTAISQNNSAYAGHLDEATYARLDPKNSSYKPLIEAAAARYDWLAPSVVAGIGSRESAWGRFLSPNGPTGTGDGGHGRGLMQIDDRYHSAFINSGLWSDAKSNIDYAIDNVLSKNYDYLDANTSLAGTDLLRGAIAAYNAGLSSVTRALAQGLDIDYYTTGQDYSWDVLNRAGWFQSNGWT
ncbi:MAG: SH3 domain-containing protein [Leptolyngbyaceae bacterium]|nr:SH3 domain-containing protein [Leptolyngbyaceae bacterium]